MTPIIREINLPLSSVDIFRMLKDDPYPFFLDSGMDPHKLGRFSFIGCDPFLILKNKDNRTYLIEKNRAKTLSGNPFHIIRGILNNYSLPDSKYPIPFIGGAVGYFAYDMRQHVESSPLNAADDLDLPDCVLGFYDRVIAIDHLLDKTYICSTGFPEPDKLAREKRARVRLDEFLRQCEHPATPKVQPYLLREGDVVSNLSKDGYLKAVEKAKEYIAAGDIYQVNLSQMFSSRLDGDSFELYERLRAINPAPFAAYLDFGSPKIISSSPERFLCLRGRDIHTRPIKGTRPRGATPVEDSLMLKELLASPKDRAEHVMIVDLERNDLGRICKYGSVRPTEFVIPEKYSTVFHLVSTISGVLKDDVDAVDCLINCFPGGSITGTPKIRSMEIIDELEPIARSIYTGSIGYISFNGNMDTSIVIRTIIAKGSGFFFSVGGGIVADSDPEAEYQETMDKAKALISAIGEPGQPTRSTYEVNLRGQPTRSNRLRE